MSRTVLMVSYTFPPQYDISAKRVAKLCKYLPAVGWHPIVLTKDWRRNVTAEDRRRFRVTMNEHVLSELRGIEVRTAAYAPRDNPLRRLHERLGGRYATAEDPPASTATTTKQRSVISTLRSIGRRTLSAASPLFGDYPDEFRGWVAPAVEAGVALVRERDVSAICSFCPPATAHVVASEIARRTGLPWVAQFDDLFSFHLDRDHRALWRSFGRLIHRRWMSRANAVGAITPGMLSYVRRTYDVEGDVVVVGFDPDESARSTPVRGERLRLVYTGSMYLDDQRPELFFAGLQRLFTIRPDAQQLIDVTFVGTRQSARLSEIAKRFPEAGRVCTFADAVPPEVALGAQREAHALILFNYTIAAEHGTLSYPAKAFEYLNAGRPIIAMPSDPGGWGDELLASTGAGLTASSAEEVADILLRWLNTWCTTGSLPYGGDPEVIKRYAQPAQAATLGGLLDQVVRDRPPVR